MFREIDQPEVFPVLEHLKTVEIIDIDDFYSLVESEERLITVLIVTDLQSSVT